MATPHDALFKEVFRKPEHARGALQAAMPAEIASAVDWSSLTRCPGSFVDPVLRERHTDLLFEVCWQGGGQALLYMLFEHQSTQDSMIAFRLLRYLVRIWERWWNDHPDATRLPVIVPVVLYHDDTPWSVPVAFDALLDVPPEVRPALEPHLVRFRYLVDDLSQLPDAQLRTRAMTALGRLVAVCFKHARTTTDLVEMLSGWVDTLREVAGASHGLEALRLVMRYLLLVSEYAQLPVLEAFLERELGPQAKDSIVTVGEQLIQQGVQQGIQQGVQQGIQQGVQQGERGVLLRLLRRRFGAEVTTDIEQRIADATPQQVERWIDGTLSAPTLADLLAG